MQPRFTSQQTIDTLQALLRGGPSVATAARQCGLTERTVRRWIAAGVVEFEANNSAQRVNQAGQLLAAGHTLHETSCLSGIPMTSLRGWVKRGLIAIPGETT